MALGRFETARPAGDAAPSRWGWLPGTSRDRRRLLAAVLAAVAVVCALTTLRPAPLATRQVWVAARDLSGGAALTAADLRSERLPVAALPDGALVGSSPAGRLLAAPVRRGEPLTDVRLLSAQLLAALGTPNAVAVPIRVADGTATAAVVRTGDRVDVIAAADPSAGGPAQAQTIVTGVRVLAVPALSGDGDGAGVLVVAATSGQAADLASAQVSDRLSVAVVPG